MMQGFGVHTFRFVNEQGEAKFVKFHLTPTGWDFDFICVPRRIPEMDPRELYWSLRFSARAPLAGLLRRCHVLKRHEGR